MNFVLAIGTVVTVAFFSWHMAPQVYAAAVSGKMPERPTTAVVMRTSDDSSALKKTLTPHKRSASGKAVEIRQ